MQQALEPANAQQQQVGTYGDTIKNSKAITDANNRAKEIEAMTGPQPAPSTKK
jgi:hypothetical protein